MTPDSANARPKADSPASIAMPTPGRTLPGDVTARARALVPYLSAGLLLAAAAWALSFDAPTPADFTFVNATEIQSIDPSRVNGQPDGRVIMALFEGLVNWHPQTLEPTPGVAESWEISDDKRTYTYHLRPNARWSDGSPVSAGDFRWTYRRMLEPTTQSEYAYELYYLKNAEKYATHKIAAGDPVEVELNELPAGARPFARGKLLKGKLLSIEKPGAKLEPADAAAQTVYVIDVEGRRRRFSPTARSGCEPCKQVLFDFDHVGVHAVDDRTLRIELENPTTYFLKLSGFYPLFPVQPKCVETHGSPNWCRTENVVSNGPFRLQSRRVRDRLRMVKSDTYWGRDLVKLNSIDVMAIESQTTALNMYLAGQVDWITSVPPTIGPELLAQQRPDFKPTPEMTTYFYRLNVTKKPLDNPLVRKALARAVDKREIVDTVTRTGEIVARCFVPPGMSGYEPASCGEYDVAEAKRLLAKAGYPGGKGFPKLTIIYNTDEGHQLIAELIQDQWKRNLGIPVEPQNMEWGAYMAAQLKLNYTVARAGWVADYTDPNTFMKMFITDGGNNQTGWSNRQYDKLVGAAAREPVADRRMRLLQQAEAILLDELPIIPIYFRVSKNMVRPHVQGFFANPIDNHPLRELSIDWEAKRRWQAGESSSAAR